MPLPLKGIEFFRGNDGQYYFRIVAKNGQILAVSEGYTRRWSAWYGAMAVKRAMRENV
jgi:uncharacterized protein YegP (UPF0339 family)